MIRDRGNKKWVSLMLPEHVELLREIAENDKKVKKPLIDQQKLEQFNELITESLFNNEGLAINYYSSGSIKTLFGTVEKVNHLRNELEVVSENKSVYKLNFNDIVDIEEGD